MTTVLVQEYLIKTTWQDEEPATPDLIDPLMADMFGTEQNEAFLAVREQAKEILTWGELNMGDFQGMLSSFYDGYKSCLEKHPG